MPISVNSITDYQKTKHVKFLCMFLRLEDYTIMLVEVNCTCKQQ